ncbi:HAMP domain-containing protein [Planktothrix sp. FACHB-1355]|uniref:histidine kinase n=1 Tax=Aerosakkonema funiforme FACHB-1375 TaxID=2949571 RepID=A0A926VCD7_9CYAN|nr:MULTISPECIES: ATP-binding protein [Oscillatoriales]MBD2180798.1 HAMP domain-containing protein [Aerosakkonema funiforme FACHB-1375]MBD3561640.1 HAMP domain-containing protein [Planktothrix sp. FACHB-1355]
MKHKYVQKQAHFLLRKTLKLCLINLSWCKQTLGNLSISSKITCGYTLAVGIAVLGTTVGLAVGNYYETKATIEAEKWHKAGEVLHKLQVVLLQTRSHQQKLIYLIQKPQQFQTEYSHLRGKLNELKSLLSEIQSSQTFTKLKELQPLAGNGSTMLETYYQQMKQLLDRTNLQIIKPEELPKLQSSLLNFTNSKTVLKIDAFSDNLTKLAEFVFQEEHKAKEFREHGEMVQVSAPIASMLISVVLAMLLAIQTSRAIARPLKDATRVAEQVTEKANFDLQVPVVTKDEVGILAASLNELIQKVKHLLEEQKAAAERQRQMQETQLIQSEKMSSLGRMLAGVAHEINNPVNFIYGNIGYANDYIQDLFALLQTYKNEIPNPPLAVQKLAEEIDIEFLEEDLPKVLQSMKMGAERVHQIVLSLKDFSRLDEAAPQSVDLHACIDSTLLILHNRIKKGINVVLNYGDIPEIEGYTGLLYQVFMNLLSNAIDALEPETMSSGAVLNTAAPNNRLVETPKNTQLKEIVITTERQDKNWVKVRIADTGNGISPENMTKIFDNFFTTKARGIGTGLGLSISRQIVEEKHGGRINFTSYVGQGSEFAIALPIKHRIETREFPNGRFQIANCIYS